MEKNNKIFTMKRELLYTSGRFFSTLYHRFFEDGCTIRAAALTYTTLLSIVPLMTVSFAIFSAFPAFGDLSLQIQNFIFSHFVAASGEVVQHYIQNFVLQTKHLSVIGSAFLVLTAILMMFNMEQAFNAIWKVDSRRMGVGTFLLYWGVLTLTPVLIGISVIMSSYLVKVAFISTTAEQTGFMTVLPFLLNLTFFTLIYRLIPNCHVPIRNGVIGALVATILFTIAKFGFTYYVIHFPTYTLLYGAFAVIPIFLAWLYLMWTIILFGVIISNLLTEGYHFRSVKKMDGFTHAFYWIGYFYEALKHGVDLSLQELVRLDSCNYEVEPTKQIKVMLASKLICETKSGRYLLSHDLANLSLTNFANLLPWRYPTQSELSQWTGKWIDALKQVLPDQVPKQIHVVMQSLYQ